MNGHLAVGNVVGITPRHQAAGISKRTGNAYEAFTTYEIYVQQDSGEPLCVALGDQIMATVTADPQSLVGVPVVVNITNAKHFNNKITYTAGGLTAGTVQIAELAKK